MGITQIDRAIATALSPHRLELTLFPTEQCNFRCTYCYEDFKVGAMSPHIVKGIKRLITGRIPSLEQLQISWFGGEPLLALDIIRDISRHVLVELARSGSFHYASNMTTNGYFLTPSVARELVGFGINRFQVSLDGSAADHDQTRIQAGGRGTFKKVFSNLLSMKAFASDFEVVLRIHSTGRNQGSVLELISRINEDFKGDDRFKIYNKHIERLGGAGDRDIVVSSQEQKSSEKSMLDRFSGQRIFRTDTEVNGQYICYAAKPNAFAIRADGRVSKCTVALRDSRNTLGFIDQNGTINFEEGKLSPWHQGVITGDSKALACPYRALGSPS